MANVVRFALRALRVGRERPGASVTLAFVMLMAMPALAQAPAEEAGKAPPPLVVGARALDAGDGEMARAAFGQAVEASPQDAAAWLGLAGAHELMGDWPAAIEAARRAVSLAPERPEPFSALARALGRAGRPNEALAAFSRVRELDPEDEEAYLLAGILLRDSDRVAAALELLSAGYERLGSTQLAEQLTYLLLAEAKPKEALATVDRALNADPERGSLLLAKALALAAGSGARDEALPWFSRAFTAGVANEGAARLEMARLLADLGQWPEAVEQLRDATRLMPNLAEGYFRLGTALRQTGDAEGAAAALTRYQELEAARVARQRAVRELGTALNEAQELASANELEAALSRLAEVPGGEQDPRVLMLRGKVLFSLARREEALTAIRRATDVAPFDVEPAYLRAAFAFALGHYPEALEQCDRTLVLEPGLGEVWALRGSALARLGRVDEAALSFARALDLGFDSPQLRLDYAGVLSDLGRVEESRRQLEERERLSGGTGEG